MTFRLFIKPALAEKKNDESGFVLVTSLFVMLLLLSLGYFVSAFSLTEKKIASSQAASVQAYYLAESGVNEAIWKLKNDTTWKNNFESSPTWSTTFVRNSALFPNASYSVEVQNISNANATITVTGQINIGLASAQRVIKTSVYKAQGASAILDSGLYSDSDINLYGTDIIVLNGGLFTNNNVNISLWATVNTDSAIRAVKNINITPPATVVSAARYATNFPPKPDPIAMPSISFDNVGDPNSLKARADHIYTASQFSDLLYANRNKTLTLNGITYVTGAVNIKYNNDLIINGALVADGNITVGVNSFWCLFGGRSDVEINAYSDDPSGLFTKGRIELEACMDNLSGEAVLYGATSFDVLAILNRIEVTGAIVTRQVTQFGAWDGFQITYDPDIVTQAIGNPTYSPVITIDHWEEEY